MAYNSFFCFFQLSLITLYRKSSEKYAFKIIDKITPKDILQLRSGNKLVK